MDDVRARSALELVKEAAGALRGADGKAWVTRLEDEIADLEFALDWFLQEGRADEAVELAASLAGFWTATGRLDLGRSWLSRSLSAGGGSSEQTRAAALFEAGLLAFWQGDDEAAGELHQQSLDTARGIGDPTLIATALSGLARVALRKDLGAAQQLCEEALGVVAEASDTRGRSQALHVLGVAAQMAGNLQAARSYMSQRLEIARGSGDLLSVSSEAANLSVVERQLGNLDRAQDLAWEALRLSHARDDEWAIPYELNGLAAIALQSRDRERAAKLLGAAEAIMRQQGASWPPDEKSHFEATKRRLVETMSPPKFDQAWAAGQEMAVAEAVAYALTQPFPESKRNDEL